MNVADTLTNEEEGEVSARRRGEMKVLSDVNDVRDLSSLEIIREVILSVFSPF